MIHQTANMKLTHINGCLKINNPHPYQFLIPFQMIKIHLSRLKILQMSPNFLSN